MGMVATLVMYRRPFFIKLSPLFPQEGSIFKLDFIGKAVSKKKRVENKGSYTYVYSPGAEADEINWQKQFCQMVIC